MVFLAALRLVIAFNLLAGAGDEPAPPRLGDIDPSVSCTFGECHVSERSAASAHAPVAKGICKMCHRRKSGDRHEFRLARDGRGLCTVCHWEIDARANVHNDLLSADCIVCHDPHGSGYRFLLPSASVSKVCEDCHAGMFEEMTALHTPVATEGCTVCHDPHRRGEGPVPADGTVFCLTCHEKTRAEIEDPEHAHAPLVFGDCSECHDPHGSDHAGNLRDEVPTLCDGCHDEIRRTSAEAAYGHSAVRAPGGCLRCHAAHASPVPSLLKSDPLTVCDGCHGSEIATDAGRTISAVTHRIDNSRYRHGPVEQRDCGACHSSHGSDNPWLLVENYTPKFYAPFDPESYRLCFSCHPERKVLTEKTTGLTGFRNGDLNLHYLHVNKQDNGRTCRVCHATHASNAPKHIRESVTFGRWDLPITFTKTETGGHCDSGCHAPRAYDRERAFDYGAAPTPAATGRPG